MFNPISSPIKSLEDIYQVNDIAIDSTGVFDRDYYEGTGCRVYGSPVVIDDDRGYLVIETPVGYTTVFYQRTRYATGLGIHNCTDNRYFAHPQSARRYVKSFLA